MGWGFVKVPLKVEPMSMTSSERWSPNEAGIKGNASFVA